MNSKILIYGATGGIGSATARLLNQRGMTLHLVARNEPALVGLAEELGAGFTMGDVLDEDLFGRVANDIGETLSGFVYAVGTLDLKALARLDRQAALHDFEVNALGGAMALQAVLPALKRHEGDASVVFFSSVAAQQGFPSHASMGMAKGAVSGLTRSLAAELAPRVRVNAIAPSLTETPLSTGLLANEKMSQALAQMHPLGRLGRPADLAHLAAFLLSPDSGWITGQVLAVDGGRSTLQTKR